MLINRDNLTWNMYMERLTAREKTRNGFLMILTTLECIPKLSILNLLLLLALKLSYRIILIYLYWDLIPLSNYFYIQV